jgi:hypothetical protein
MFQLNFHRAKVDSTVTGVATVTVRPAGAGISHDPNAYIPGQSAGPPTLAENAGMPETWQDLAITDGTIWLTSDHADAPGTVTIDVAYDINVVDKANLITGVFLPDGATAPQLQNSRLRWNKSKDYKRPASGNLVVLNIIPEVKEVCDILEPRVNHIFL